MMTGRLVSIGLLTTCGLLFASGAVFAADTNVGGTVTVSGVPLGGGQIVLHVDNGEFLGTTISKEGTYAFRKLVVPPGKYIVTISGKAVPEKYSDATTTGLQVEVREGDNVFDFALR